MRSIDNFNENLALKLIEIITTRNSNQNVCKLCLTHLIAVFFFFFDY